MKEVSGITMALRLVGQLAAAAGVMALLVWVTVVMLDLKHLQSGFTLP